ncbi:MAG TPA: DnaD domain protein [Candidatus Pelethenecus sp.]|nr:DnaD domain protein [Candidatus Pelethenecus sp.]
MNRVLTASELEILQGLIVEDHYTYDQIVNVVDYITSSNRTLSMKTIASNLANRKYQIQPEVDAPASFQEFLKRI